MFESVSEVKYVSVSWQTVPYSGPDLVVFYGFMKDVHLLNFLTEIWQWQQLKYSMGLAQ